LVSTLDILSFVLRTQALLMLGVYSVYSTVEKETKKEGAGQNPGALLRDEFKGIFRERGIAFAVVASCAIAIVTEAMGTVGIEGLGPVPIWVGSYFIINGLLLFFLLEIVYHSLSRWLPPILVKNKYFEIVIHSGAFTGSLLVSGSVYLSCLYAGILCSTVEPFFFWFALLAFSSILFVSGLGGIGVIDTISNAASSHVPRGRKTHAVYIVVLFGSFLGLYLFLNGNRSLLGTGNTLLAGAGIEVALSVGIAYSAYSAARKRMLRYSTTLVYAFLMLGLSSLFIVYSVGNRQAISLPASPPSLDETLLLYAAPLILFAIGYSNLMFWMPRSLEKKMGSQAGTIFPSLTFFMLFAVLSVYEGAAHSFGPAIFLLQSSITTFPALMVGALVFSVGKVRLAERKRRSAAAIGETIRCCAHCDANLDLSSKYCWKCGNAATSSKPEKVWFKGYATLIKKETHYHSPKGKLATTLIGGPIGYFLFAKSVTLKHEAEGPLVVTDSAVYFGDRRIPLNKIDGTGKGHYSNSISLRTDDIGEKHSSKNSGSEMEFKTDDIEHLTESLRSIITNPNPGAAPAATKSPPMTHQ
jgi:hypothetical protein